MTTIDLRGNWEAAPLEANMCRATLPRDPMRVDPALACPHVSPVHQWWCTRPAGHGRRHAASVGDYFVAVWR